MSLGNGIPKVGPGEKYPANNPEGKGLKPRVSQYNPEFHDENVFNLLVLGKTVKQICGIFGISDGCYKQWMQAHPTFFAAIIKGKELASGQVVGALFKKATGFTQTVQKPMVVGQGDGFSKVEVVEYEHYHAPDTSAIKFFLSNMERDKFAERKEVTVAKTIVVEMDLGDGRPPKEIVSNAKELAPPEPKEEAYTPFEDLPEDEEDTGDTEPLAGWPQPYGDEEEQEEDIDLLDL